ncbi:ABC transporter ATP-binding protein [Paralimibaculum aggregatum]|uniref:ABC transporter ATP-binding protein n=1 Tax=Paralimibaculum aggregatum TaxID=3036245 RepID=A0ABQ6LLG7_9RHOB|nr:ABC transporter transmembrane domain-containing protein [Limibaculum sp. NKW23]GMG81509.1 ABC transporter ATP-binding protein [Limibaculum sp. NKW23]
MMDSDREGTLVGFVWRHSRREQCLLLLLTALSFPVVYLSLEVPKLIINEAISGGSFPVRLGGVELGRIGYLMVLSIAFLLLVVANNGIKWLINVGLGICGERLLRRLRFALTERVVRFPMKRLRSLRQGETIQSIMGEIEPLGGFFGEVIVTPVFQLGLFAVFLGFIFVQDVWLGLAAVAFYPVQTILVPVLQARIVALNRARAGNARTLADRIGTLLQLTAEIRSHGTAPWHLSEIAGLLGENAAIRERIFRRKYTIKFLNNFLSQLTPFLLFSIGGYLVIRGALDLGALVAVLAACKELAGPWRALLGYVQRLSDFSSRYRFVQEGFRADGMLAGRIVAGAAGPALHGPLVVEDVPAEPPLDRPAIPRLELPAGGTAILRGGNLANRGAVLRVAAGIDPPEQGRVAIGGTSLEGVPHGAIGAALALVPEAPGLIPGSIRTNLVYGLLRRAGTEAGTGAGAAPGTGPAADAAAPWVDHAAAGVAGPEALEARILDLAGRFGLAPYLRAAAMDRRLTAAELGAWSGPLMRLRHEMAAQKAEIGDLVEPWDAARFNGNGTLLANLLYALPTAPAALPAAYLQDPALRGLLRRLGADRLLLEIGRAIARDLAEIAGSIGSGSGILDRVPGFGRQDILEAAAILARSDDLRRAPSRREAAWLMGLAANFVQTRDKLDVLDAAAQARVLALRARALPLIRGSPAYATFDAETYHPARTVAENILHARRRFDRRSAWGRIDQAMEQAISAQGLGAEILRLGLDAPVAAGAVPAAVLRRIALLRGLLKRPRILLVAVTPDLHPDGEAALLREIRALLPEAALLLAVERSGGIAPGPATVWEIDARGRMVSRA